MIDAAQHGEISVLAAQFLFGMQRQGYVVSLAETGQRGGELIGGERDPIEIHWLADVEKKHQGRLCARAKLYLLDFGVRHGDPVMTAIIKCG